jgi:oxygen-dependent protoporphyrinogen oxidase
MPDGMRMMVPSRLEAVAESPIFSEEAKQAYQREIGRADELKAYAMARPPDVDESVATFVERHFGGEVAEKIAGPLLAGVFGGDVHQLSAISVMAPLVKMEREYGSLILALQNRLDFEKDQPVFTTLRGGLQSLVERISQILAPGSVRLNETVLSVKSVTDGWEVATASTRASFDQVVLATPAHVTRQLVSTWSADLDKLLDFESTSSVVAALAFDPARAAYWEAPTGFGFLVSPDRAKRATGTELSLLACTFVEQKFPHRVPPGAKLLRAFYGDEAATTLLSASDSEVVTLAHRQLARVFGGLPQPTLSAVRRWPRSLPQYTVGHADRVVRAEAIVGGLPGLHLAGNALHGVGISDLVRQGRSIGVRLAS